ncbi:ABC transporter ATP-binding protein [Desulfolutivibrio sp.]|uniref:ABC transporter ATP-binding protein n=1 Tax=Desulfolutivibrio sp. TaxID=2773296 RepID=UPI002F96AAE3
MALIELTGISKTYHTGQMDHPALDGITIAIEPARLVTFIGPSGSGKTTLLNIIGCMDKPTAGEVRVAGMRTDTLNRRQAAAFRGGHLGFIFQSFNLIPVLSVYENVEYPLIMINPAPAPERRERVLRVLEAVGMTDHKEKRPDQVSGGQKQRVAVARALVTNPQVVLADEPTANLDQKTAQRIIALMRQMRDAFGTTFIFSTHDPRIVEHADEIHTLEDGRLVKENQDVTGGAPHA